MVVSRRRIKVETLDGSSLGGQVLEASGRGTATKIITSVYVRR